MRKLAPAAAAMDYDQIEQCAQCVGPGELACEDCQLALSWDETPASCLTCGSWPFHEACSRDVYCRTCMVVAAILVLFHGCF